MPDSAFARIATPDDHESIARLFQSSYPALMRPDYEPAVLESALPVITRANPMLLASGTFFLAETANGRVIGCGGWTRERPGTGDVTRGVGNIRHFATHPAHIGLGIGRTIYNMCEQQARSAGVKRFECYASLNAGGFYTALGFETIERVTIRLNDQTSLPAILMARSI